jgi:zinc-binding in reverse transcriptase
LERVHRLRAIDPSMPSSAIDKITKHLHRRHTAWLIQMCTGHVPLNRHLHRIGKANSLKCPVCKEKDETVHHFLIECKAYAAQRKEMERKLKCDARSMRTLLLNSLTIPTVFKFISQTGHFREAQKNLEFTAIETLRWKEMTKRDKRRDRGRRER